MATLQCLERISQTGSSGLARIPAPPQCKKKLVDQLRLCFEQPTTAEADGFMLFMLTDRPKSRLVLFPLVQDVNHTCFSILLRKDPSHELLDLLLTPKMAENPYIGLCWTTKEQMGGLHWPSHVPLTVLMSHVPCLLAVPLHL